MTIGPIEFLGHILRTFWSRVFAGALGAMAVYQFGCDQFGWPTVPAAWQVSGAKIPWWGWLLLLQTLLTAGLFEYARRNAGAPRATIGDDLASGEYGGDSPDLPALMPDISYSEVLQRVMKIKVTKAEAAENLAAARDKVANEIMDKVHLNKMSVWGRFGQRPIEVITPDEWKRGTLFAGKGILKVPNTITSIEYGDLHFNRAQIDASWPALEEANTDAH